MENITIQIENISTALASLNSVKESLDQSKSAFPIPVGGGKTIDKLMEIAEAYQLLNTAMSVLVNNTISFLNSTGLHFSESDETAAEKLGGGGFR